MAGNTRKRSRRRQWGSDRHMNPMPAVPRMVGDWTLGIGRIAVLITVGSWLALVLTVLIDQFGHGSGRAGIVQTLAFLTVVTLLTGSASAYLIGRLGFYYRARTHRRIARARIDEFFAEHRPSLTTLVPSYQEEASVIRMTLLSAALQEYPDQRIVLLIDDPPDPRYAEPYAQLQAARALPGEVQALLAVPRARLDRALEQWEPVLQADRGAYAAEVLTLAEHYEYASSWVRTLADDYAASDHNERFFATHVLGSLAADLGLTASALKGAAEDDPAKLSVRRLAELYRRLAWTFRAELTSFERKQYVSLSREPNKAMNLNSYIGLMGGRHRDVRTPGGRALMPAAAGEPADLVIPNTDYVMTLDADGTILPEYCLRLVYLLEQPENARIAVAQTPYSAYPGSATRLERIAGATTDLQHIIHQGMTYHGASFWVGANAVLRKAALDDVCTTDHVGGWPIKTYIQDRTLIEDTESTINLATEGWETFNYNERLSYSETPPDFGALCIQRHRWANGGLLILPKMWRLITARRRRGDRTSASELLLRVNYMASIFWSSISVLFLLSFPFNGHLLSPLTFLVAAPYFVAMALDLRYCGYKALDVLRVYGFNLLLLPVNLAGSLSSIVQGLTGAKGRFRRTPKVRDRTVPALIYVVLPYLLVALSVYTAIHAYHRRLWGDVAFAAINAVLATYAILAFVGLWNSLRDIAVNIASYLYKAPTFKPVPSRGDAPAPAGPDSPMADWELVLYLGHADRRRNQRPAPVPAAPTATDDGTGGVDKLAVGNGNGNGNGNAAGNGHTIGPAHVNGNGHAHGKPAGRVGGRPLINFAKTLKK